MLEFGNKNTVGEVCINFYLIQAVDTTINYAFIYA